MELIVAGFHRSGTSLASQLLHKAGLFVGDDLLGAMESNPYGHFEDRRVVTTHDSILQSNGLTWQVSEHIVPHVPPESWAGIESFVAERHTEHLQWGFKDPRVCMFLPVWKHVLPDAKILIIYRHPLAAVESLERRHARQMLSGMPGRQIHERFWKVPDLGLKMWLVHNESLIMFARQNPESVMVVPHHSLRDGWPLTRRIIDRWGFDLEDTPSWKVYDPSVTTAEITPRRVWDESLIDRVKIAWNELEELAAICEREES